MRRVVLFFSGFQFFFMLLWWLPVFYAYQKHFGLTDPEIFRIQSIYYLAFCFLEIPTGTIADTIGYRRCLQIGALVLIAANLMAIWAPTYPGFLAHFLLIGLARSFVSGASSAYLYDFLHASGKGTVYKEIEGSARAYSLVGKVAAWAAIGALMSWHITLPYWLTVGSAVCAFGFALKLPDLPRKAGTERRAFWWKNLRGAFDALRTTPSLVPLILQGVAIFVLGRIVQVNLFQPILNARGIGLGTHGLVMAAMTLFEALGSSRPGWLRGRLSDVNAVFVLSLAMGAAMVGVVLTGAVGSVAALCVFSLVMGFAYPIQRQVLNDAIPDSRFRATILSFESIVDRAVCAWVAWVLGNALAGAGMDTFLLRSSLVTVVGMAAIFAVMRRTEPRASQGPHAA